MSVHDVCILCAAGSLRGITLEFPPLSIVIDIPVGVHDCLSRMW